MIIAYLMVHLDLSVTQALRCIQRVRYLAQPNPGFITQLENFQHSMLKNEIRKNLEHMIPDYDNICKRERERLMAFLPPTIPAIDGVGAGFSGASTGPPGK